MDETGRLASKLSRLMNKRPGYSLFFIKNPFSPADESVFTQLVVRSCHFDVTACAEARPLGQPARIYTSAIHSQGWQNILVYIKHRKNCECCPRHSLFKGHNVIQLLEYPIPLSSVLLLVCHKKAGSAGLARPAVESG